MGDDDWQLQDLIADRDIASPEEAAIQGSLAEQVRIILATLTPREEKILRRRFGIGEKTEHTLRDVGKECGISHERVRQIEARALTKLSHASQSKRMLSWGRLTLPRSGELSTVSFVSKSNNEKIQS
jgi:RNA polymerase primary sigma factor